MQLKTSDTIVQMCDDHILEFQWSRKGHNQSSQLVTHQTTNSKWVLFLEDTRLQLHEMTLGKNYYSNHAIEMQENKNEIYKAEIEFLNLC